MNIINPAGYPAVVFTPVFEFGQARTLALERLSYESQGMEGNGDWFQQKG